MAQLLAHDAQRFEDIESCYQALQFFKLRVAENKGRECGKICVFGRGQRGINTPRLRHAVTSFGGFASGSWIDSKMSGAASLHIKIVSFPREPCGEVLVEVHIVLPRHGKRTSISAVAACLLSGDSAMREAAGSTALPA